MKAIKKAIFMSMGALTLAREKAKALADDLAQKGETSEAKEAKFVRSWIDKAEKKVQQVHEKARPRWRIEIDKLNAKLDHLTGEVEKLSKGMQRR